MADERQQGERTDPTMDPLAAFGSTRWVAARLGLSSSSFQRRKATLEEYGFPARDGLLGLYLKADVDAWIEARRRVIVDRETQPRTSAVNFDAL